MEQQPNRSFARSGSNHDAVVETYLAELVGAADAQLGSRLVGVWLFGSAALGDFDPQRSDLDVQAVSSAVLPSLSGSCWRRRSRTTRFHARYGDWSSCYTRAGTWPASSAPRFSSI